MTRYEIISENLDRELQDLDEQVRKGFIDPDTAHRLIIEAEESAREEFFSGHDDRPY